ncbi:MAG TPA: DUF4328 domain-containing protein [Vicinamibacteria bacterium]|nr:DUF4328 domain-containing protein [Vicinamibacteria bacterium]
MSSNPYRPPSHAERASAGAFRELGPLSLAISVVFFMEAVALLSMSALMTRFTKRTGSAGFQPSPEDTESMMLALGGGLSAILFLLLYFCGLILLCLWVYRANANLEVLVPSGSEFTPGWAVGWFFVPIANLFKPYQVVSEIYRASDPAADPDYWNLAPLPFYLPLWWGSYLVFNVLTNFAPFGMLQAGCGVVSMATLVTIVRSVRRMQEEKVRGLSSAQFAEARPAPNPLLP